MKKKREPTVSKPVLRLRSLYPGASTAEWLGALRDFLLEHRDTDVPVDEQRCQALHELERESRRWLRNAESLLDFRRALESGMAKPQIFFLVELTSKDNLSVRWMPAPLDQQTFDGWQRDRFLSDYPPQRPHNEIAFVRGIGRLRLDEDDWHHDTIGPHLNMRNRLLVYATRAFVMEIEEFLQQFFEVTSLTAFDFVLDSEGQLVDWSVDDADEVWVRNFEKKTLGVPLELFCRLCRSVGGDDTALAKRLREEGFPKITTREVRPAIDRFRVYSGWERF